MYVAWHIHTMRRSGIGGAVAVTRSQQEYLFANVGSLQSECFQVARWL